MSPPDTPALSPRPIFSGDLLTPRQEDRFGIYVHVPFCASRCGYCDFNTYTPGELHTATSKEQWLHAIEVELDLASKALGLRAEHDNVVPVKTVFVGGGTPSLLGAPALKQVLDLITDRFPVSSDWEATCEANPESTSPEFFAGIREAGYTRVSLGMQSAAAHVLAVLDRVHTPGRAVAAVQEAKKEGIEHINVDLIYGTPGESVSDLVSSLEVVSSADIDHVSAYALTVHSGTAMGRAVAKGTLTAPDDDDLAESHSLVDRSLQAAGFDWYEVSNWSKSVKGQCRHNRGYWQGGDWWGVGPGAHSHHNGVRWWNVKHPSRYAALTLEGQLPVEDFEILSTHERHTEDVMLGLRMREGISSALLSATEYERTRQLIEDGFLREVEDRVVLMPSARMLADGLAVHILSG